MFTLVYEPDPQTSLSVYRGVVVAEDVTGGWNLTLLPLGIISSIMSSLASIEESIGEAVELGADMSAIQVELAAIGEEFMGTTDEDVLEDILRRLEEMEVRVEVLAVSTLIQFASDLIDEARGMGIDTSRHEIFLSRAREEFDKGNYGPARQFINYPLGLREEVPETFLVFFLLAGGLVPSVRRFTSRSRALP